MNQMRLVRFRLGGVNSRRASLAEELPLASRRSLLNAAGRLSSSFSSNSHGRGTSGSVSVVLEEPSGGSLRGVEDEPDGEEGSGEGDDRRIYAAKLEGLPYSEQGLCSIKFNQGLSRGGLRPNRVKTG